MMPGISANGNSYTPKDFIGAFSSRKSIYGNPYLSNHKVNGSDGKASLTIQKGVSKSSGLLEIEIDVPFEVASNLNELIENSGVSAFYLGKKGLAYVDKIYV